ncbi:Dbl domain containing protein [Aphelenchoides avenae]|nr:Dbl domain containing protein [Aphelenchus avenae]
MHSTTGVDSELYPAVFTAEDYECNDSDSETLTGEAHLIFHRSHRSADAVLDSSPPTTRQAESELVTHTYSPSTSSARQVDTVELSETQPATPFDVFRRSRLSVSPTDRPVFYTSSVQEDEEEPCIQLEEDVVTTDTLSPTVASTSPRILDIIPAKKHSVSFLDDLSEAHLHPCAPKCVHSDDDEMDPTRGIVHKPVESPITGEHHSRSKSEPPSADRFQQQALVPDSQRAEDAHHKGSPTGGSPSSNPTSPMSLTEVMNSSLIGTNFDDSLDGQRGEFKFLKEMMSPEMLHLDHSPLSSGASPQSAPPCPSSNNIFSFEAKLPVGNELPCITEDGREDDSRPCSSQQLSPIAAAEDEPPEPALLAPGTSYDHLAEETLPEYCMALEVTQSDAAISASSSTASGLGENITDSVSSTGDAASRDSGTEEAISNDYVPESKPPPSERSLSVPRTPLLDRHLSSSTPSIAEAATVEVPALKTTVVDKDSDVRKRSTTDGDPTEQLKHLRVPFGSYQPPAEIPTVKLRDRASTSKLQHANTTDAKRLEKDKKRDSKNGMTAILWSLRQKTRKPKDNRSLANAVNAMNAQRKDSEAGINRRQVVSDPSEELPYELAKVLGSGATGTVSSLSSNASERSPLSPSLMTQSVEDTQFPKPQLVKQKWKDLDLWAEDGASWSAQHADSKLPTSEKKRQNVIYEFYCTEKHHCQNIIILQQAYQVGLLNQGILTEDEVKQLIPDVLDSLLDFHLGLLRKLKERQAESDAVETISDIIVEEFETGDLKAAAINAYTSFCLSREDSYKVYASFMQKNADFKRFFEHYESLPQYKGHSFKSCLLLIAQRLTKYPVLVEQISKYEGGVLKSTTQRAHSAVKSFALRVDRELWKYELNRRWEGIRKNLDRNSVGQLLGSKFTYDDLVHQDPSDFRRVLSIGTVYWQSITGQKIELCLVLFDDIVAFFQNKNGQLQFFAQKDHASVIPLHTALIREMERTNEVMLIVLAKQKPDMYRLVFNNKTEMQQWIQAIKAARAIAPKYVRTAKGQKHIECATRPIGDDGADPEEVAFNAALLKWQKELDAIFGDRMDKESQLQDYMLERMKFFDAVRVHLKKFPKRAAPDAPVASVKHKDSREVEKMKTLLRNRFQDLRKHRRSTLDKLVEMADKARDSDLVSFFDDFYELSHAEGSDSFGSSATSSEESDEVVRNNKPRRVRTYHGAADAHPKGIRRHTTVPKLGSQSYVTDEDAETFDEQVDMEVQRLPLRTGTQARKAATLLIKENVALRIENNKLRSENALQDLHLASLKARKTPLVETAEKLESLRQKQEEIQQRERDFKQECERRLQELRLKEEDLERREASLRSREAQLAGTATSNGDATASHRPLSTSRVTTFRSGSALNEMQHSPVRGSSAMEKSVSTSAMPRHLAVKTETKQDRRKKK